jgi:hypothetical protein
LNSNEVWGYSLLEVDEKDERLNLLPASQNKKNKRNNLLSCTGSPRYIGGFL